MHVVQTNKDDSIHKNKARVTVSVVIIPSLKSIGNFNITKLTNQIKLKIVMLDMDILTFLVMVIELLRISNGTYLLKERS